MPETIELDVALTGRIPDFLDVAAFMPVMGSSTPHYVGWNNAASGLTARQPVHGNVFTEAARIGIATSASSGQIAHTRHQALVATRGTAAGLGGFRFKARVGVQAVASGARQFVGLMPTGSAPSNVNPSTLTQILGIGKDETDSNWQIIHNDGSGVATKIDTGIPATTAETDIIDVEFVCLPFSLDVSWKIIRLNTNTVTTGTINADLPAGTAAMAPHAWISNNATAAVAALDIFGMILRRYKGESLPFDVGPPPPPPDPDPEPDPGGGGTGGEPTVVTQRTFVMDENATVRGVAIQAHCAGRKTATNGYDSILMINDGDKMTYEIRNTGGVIDRASWDPSNKVRSEFFQGPRAQRGQLMRADFEFVLESNANPAAMPHTRDWLILYQIHQADPQNGASGSNLRNSIGLSPLFAFGIYPVNGAEVMDIRGDTGTASVQTSFSPQRIFSQRPFARDTRYKMRIEVVDSNGRLASDTGVTPTPQTPLVDGAVRVWINDVQVVNFSGRVGYWCCAPENAGGASVGSYIKYGIYGSVPDSGRESIETGLKARHYNLVSSITG